ncbi:MAG TPA: hypothetical protein VKT33_12085 [Candidatus Angelobacter sp.]|nr:hypothetical protein [Candidatus Angelobacter sp.]
MADHDTDREMNTLLDSLLAAYSSAEPRPGLENRIQVTLKAAARRRRIWWLTFASSAAVAAILVLVVFVTGTRTAKRIAPAYAVLQKPSQSLPDHHPAKLPLHPRPKRNGNAKDNSLKALPDASRIALQVANTQPVFEHEESYLRPDTPPAAEAAPAPVHEQQAAVPSISIQDLGVRSIEIKQLNAEKDKN